VTSPRERHPIGLPADLATLERCLVMGVLNVTPDSFSDGGPFLDPDRALAHGPAPAEAGAGPRRGGPHHP